MNMKNKPNILGVFILLVISFATFNMRLNAQTPGGATKTLKLWLSADRLQAPLPQPNSNVTSWVDLSPSGNNFVQNGTDLVPRINYNGMNFSPSVEFYSNEDSETASTTVERQMKLVTQNNYSLSTSEAYYTFWVSTVENARSSANASVFAVPASTTANDYGWRNSSSQALIRHSTRGTSYNYANTSASYSAYGIGSAIQPNITGVVQQQYYNGLTRTATTAARTMNVTSGKGVLGNSALTGTTNYFFGEIQELIVYKGSVGEVMSASEIQSVNTYLAIKYGITLQVPDYVDPAGVKVWDSSRNTGYRNDIFGIAQDSRTELNQKQSQSTSNPILTVFLGDLANLNINNTSSGIGDRNYVMFGSNNATGVTSAIYPAGTQFQNAQTSDDLNTRRNIQLKAQVTSSSGSAVVNMKPNVGAVYLMVGSDATFSPANTRIYKVENDIAKNVLVNNGDYVGFITYINAPGAIADGLKMWLNADNRSTITLNGAGEVIKWKEQSGNGTEYANIVSGSTAPLYKVCDEQMNYHSAVNFRKEKEYLSTQKGPMDASAPDNYTFFTALNNDFGASDRSYFASFGKVTRDYYPALGVRGDASGGRGRIYNRSGGGSIDGKKNLFHPGATTIVSHILKKNQYFQFEFDGDIEKVTDTSAGRSAGLNGPGTLGTGGSSDARNMIGVMGEMIAYERELSQDEKNKIYGYLGLKYAITLDLDKASTATNFDYVLSNSTSVWPGTTSSTHRLFHNNVAGLVRDDDATLDNKQARSTDTGATVHMGIGNSLGCDGVLTGLPVDKSAIMWGHDGATGTTSFAGNQDICGAFDLRLNRVWLVDKTGVDNQAVMVAAGSSDVFPYASAGYQAFLLVAETADDIRNNNWSRVVPGTFVNGEHVFNYTFTSKYTYFTFAVKALPGSCETCGFSGVKTLSFTSKNWDRGAMTNSFDLGDGFTVDVKIDITSPASMVKKYPRSSSYSSLREYRTGDVSKYMTTTITPSVAAATEFDIYEIDYRSGRYDEIEVYGLCEGATIMPELSYVADASKSSYTISGNKAKAKRRPTSTYTNKRGRMHVEFTYPVEQIIVKQKSTGKMGSSRSRIGISPISFICPQPMPPINEDGLAFTKQGPSDVLLCEEVPYTFRIVNTNCAPKPVNFEDVLPAGMKWLIGSLSLDEGVAQNAVINTYGGASFLKIDNMVVPGSSTFTFRARAIFDEDAPAGTYKNRGSLTYERIVDGNTTDVSLVSCDRLTPGCEETQTNAAAVTDKPQRLTVDEYKADMSCYRESKRITMTIKINNPNTYPITNGIFEAYFNNEFRYVANSLKCTTISFGTVTDEYPDGSISADNGFSIPSGSHTITFQIDAPAKADLENETDENGTVVLDDNGDPVIAGLNVGFDIDSDTEDVCMQGSTSNLSGVLDIPYCLSKPCIISNKNVTSKFK